MEENDSAIIQSDGNVTTTNGYDNSASHHSGSVNLIYGSKRNGRRAAIFQLDGNQTLNSDNGTTSETDVISEYKSEGELDAEPDSDISCPSDIIQCDGGNSLNSSTNNDSMGTLCDSVEEVDGDSEEEEDEAK